MFVILLDYVAPLEEIDRHMKAHVAFLRTCYDGGLFVASGRRRPRTGGVILARGDSAEEVKGIMNMDPFVRMGLARFELVAFRTSQYAAAFAPFADPGGRAMG